MSNEKMTKKECGEKLEEVTTELKKLYDKKNKLELPLIVFLPHKYGVAYVRSFPQSVVDKAEDGDADFVDIASPLANVIAHMLGIKRASVVLRGGEARDQKMSDTVAYDVLTVLLAELLAAGRVDDDLDLANAPGMAEAVKMIEGMCDDDDEEDDCECEECDCDECKKGVCVKKKDGTVSHVRGMEMALDDLTPKQVMKLMNLLMDDELSDEEKGRSIEKMMKDLGGKPISKDRLKRLAAEHEEDEEDE